MLSRRWGEQAAPALRSLLARLRTDSLLRNSVYIMATTALTAGTGYLFWIIAARMYPAENVGLASALIGVMMLAATLANLGIGPTLIQVLPRKTSGAEWSLTLNAVMVTGVLASLATGTIAALTLPVVSPKLAIVSQHSEFTLALIVGVPLLTLAATLDAMFTAERVAGNMLTRSATFALMRLPLIVTPVLLGIGGAITICVAWVVAAGCSVVVGAMLAPRLRRSYRLVLRGLLAQMRAMLSMVAGQQLISLGALAPIYLLPVIVVARLSLAENAYFYTAWQVGSIFFMVSPSVATSLLAEGSHTPAAILQKAKSSVLIISGLMCPLMLVAVIGGRLILSMFGPTYALYGYSLLVVLVLSAIPDAITNVYVSVLRVQRRFAWAAALNLGMAGITIALAWKLLPILGIAGAGWAWLIAQFSGTVVVAIHAAIYAARERAALASAQGRHERILLIIDPCSAGESLRVAPYVRMIRRSAPSAFITLAGNQDALNALGRLEEIDRSIRSDLYLYRPYHPLITRLLQIRAWLGLLARVGVGYDRALTFYWGGPLQHALAFAVCRGARAGYGSYPAALSRWLLTSRLGAFQCKERHAPQHMALLRAAGIEPGAEVLPSMQLTEADSLAVTLLLQEHLVAEDAPLLILHPGSDWACQQWLQSRWAELGDALATRYPGSAILFTGTANETRYVEAIQERMASSSTSFTGKTTLSQLAALLARASLCVCVDSAVFEVTQAVGIPVVALAGPSRPDTGLSGAVAPVIVRRMDDELALKIGVCQDKHNANNEPGCWDYSCPMSGLREITVADALQAVESAMSRRGVGAPARAQRGGATQGARIPATHALLAELFVAFERENIRWLVMRGEEALDEPGDDVDLLIAAEDAPCAQTLLDGHGYLSCPTMGRGTHHFYVGYHPASQTWATLDVVSELTFGPYLSLRSYAAAGALARRRRLGSVFVPDPDDAFWMLFLHCALDKGVFAPHRAAQLTRLAPSARVDGPLARQVALAAPAGWDPQHMIEAVQSGDWDALATLSPALFAGFRRREPITARARSLVNRLLQAVEAPLIRIFRPGVSVALLGPDGAGKSYLAGEIRRSFYVPVRSVYMGLWKSGPTQTERNDKAERAVYALARRAVEIAGRAPKAWSRYMVALYHKSLGRVVVFDRYVYDALAPSSHSGSVLKRGYMWALGHSCPAPDLVLVLDAPGEVMYARKGEDSPEALEIQRQGLLALRGRVPHVQVVDATRDAADVRADVLNRIWREYRNRRQPLRSRD
ncbi:MAG TPA: glycosyltransferase family 9 protein [Ktedonobacterales bacterium]